MSAADSSIPANLQEDGNRPERPICSARQLEFEFAAIVTTSPPKRLKKRKATTSASSGRRRSDIRAKRSGDDCAGTLSEPIKAAGFGEEWIEWVCDNIINSKDLRGALKLSACCLSALLDFEIESRGYGAEWKEEHSMYCSIQFYGFTPEGEEEISVPSLAWAFARFIFDTYDRSDQMSDWELFEEFCSGEMAPEDSEEKSPEWNTIHLFSGCLWAIHDMVCNQGASVFSKESWCSVE